MNRPQPMGSGAQWPTAWTATRIAALGLDDCQPERSEHQLGRRPGPADVLLGGERHIDLAQREQYG